MPDAKHEGKYITYEELDGGPMVRIMLNRPETRNAQNRGLLVELDEAFHRAEEDDTVRVVILGGVGPLFSSGHDMGSKEAAGRAGTRARPAPLGDHQRGYPERCRATDAPGVELLLPEHPALAQSPQDHRRPGAGHGLCGRSHAHVGL